MENQAILYKADGTQENINPANGTNFSLKEMQTLVGGYIEVHFFDEGEGTLAGKVMVIDEEGKCKSKPLNQNATDLLADTYLSSDYIVGDIMVIYPSQIE